MKTRSLVLILVLLALELSACSLVPEPVPLEEMKLIRRIEPRFDLPDPCVDGLPTFPTDLTRLFRDPARRSPLDGFAWSTRGGDETHRWLESWEVWTLANTDTPNTGYEVTCYARVDMIALRVDRILIELPEYSDIGEGLECVFYRQFGDTEKDLPTNIRFRLEIETRFPGDTFRWRDDEPFVFGDLARSVGARVLSEGGESLDLHDLFLRSHTFAIFYVFEGTERRAIFELKDFQKALTESPPELRSWPKFHDEHHYDPPNVDPHPVAFLH